MFDDARFDGGGEDTIFRDIIFLALAGFVAIVVILLPHIAEPGTAAEDSLPPGQVIVELRWPDDQNADVDLWVRGPGDVPVGYSNKGGALFNLLRDDLGKRVDATEMNYEVAYSRGVLPGEYVVNLHLYRQGKAELPLPATVVVSVKVNATGRAVQLLASKPELSMSGQELTVFRFRLDEAGSLVAGSVSTLPESLRSPERS